MNKTSFSIPLIILLLAAAVIFFRFFQANTVQTSSDSTPIPAMSTSTENKVGLANPASTFCVEKGGNLQIQTRGDGGQYGLCYFDDARACEEWAMMRSECPVGGVKTTGYDTIDQKFCAWSGGKTLAVQNSQCEFPSGKVCSTIDFYNGTCTK